MPMTLDRAPGESEGRFSASAPLRKAPRCRGFSKPLRRVALHTDQLEDTASLARSRAILEPHEIPDLRRVPVLKGIAWKVENRERGKVLLHDLTILDHAKESKAG